MVMGDMEMSTDLLVIGGGPAGYSCAFRAADLGLDVVLVDQFPTPGGANLFRGSIPSKSLLHLCQLISDTKLAKNKGVLFGQPEINLSQIRKYKKESINSIGHELLELSKKKSILQITGTARFESSKTVRLKDSEYSRIHFKNALIATGTNPGKLQGITATKDPRIMNAGEALELQDIPPSMLVVGGGYVGIELGYIYSSLGCQVTLLTQSDRILPTVDQDLVQPLEKKLASLFKAIHTGGKISSIKDSEQGLEVTFTTEKNNFTTLFAKILVAADSCANTKNLGLETTEVDTDNRGFIICNDKQQTADRKIYASGDVRGGTLLAHKAMHEGRIAAENICGIQSGYDIQATPVVIFTDPQISWCGLQEDDARHNNTPFTLKKINWNRSSHPTHPFDESSGITKLLTDPESGRLLGAGIVGRNAGFLISEVALAIEMGALTEDLALTLHPHPTLAETLAAAASDHC